jgi:hypothetical protein
VSLRTGLIAGGLTAVVALLAWLVFAAVPRRQATPTQASAAPTPAPVPPGRKIKARLLYVADDGVRLASAERDVPFGEGTVGQARELVNAQIAPVADPVVSAVPAGTTLRALFVTDRGEAFVDLSREFATAHTGGTTDELLSVYTIVNALTINLPAITSVQVLVDGKEVDTLAGHVDLRRPLTRNLALVQ